MPRRALAAPLALALVAMPALAQQQGAPGTPGTHPRAVPGTEGVTAVPDTGQMNDSGAERGSTNHPDSIPPGPPGAQKPFDTGPLQGGGGPGGQHSPVPGQRSDTGSPDARIVLAQAQMQGPGSPPSLGARVEEQLRSLYARLRITPAQQPSWNVFASTMKANTVRMEDLWRARRRAEPVSALDDMRAYARIAQAHAEDMQRLVAAFTPLYESLSPEQKTAADQAFRQAAGQAQGVRGAGAQP